MNNKNSEGTGKVKLEVLTNQNGSTEPSNCAKRENNS